MNPINVGTTRDIIPKRAGDLPHCPCGCDEIVIMAACHDSREVHAYYDHGEKVIILLCAVDNRLIAKFKVAD